MKLDEQDAKAPSLFPSNGPDNLVEELNERVCNALKLTDRERILIRDLVHVRLALNDGRIGRNAVRVPSQEILTRYARRLQNELDGFVGDVLSKRHNVGVVYDDITAMVSLELVPKRERISNVLVARADQAEVRAMEKTRERLCEEYTQWVYFNRNLRIYEKERTFLLKPMQAFHWTETQAMADAADIIAETMDPGDES